MQHSEAILGNLVNLNVGSDTLAQLPRSTMKFHFHLFNNKDTTRFRIIADEQCVLREFLMI